MIRENYSSSGSGSSTVDLTNYVTKSELNSSVVKVIKNLDSDNYKESEGLTTTIHDETISNLTTGYNSTQYSNMTNLNNWVESKIVNGSTDIYNKIKSELFVKEMNHKPISNINFTIQSKIQSGGYQNWSFNTNSLSFNEIKTVTGSSIKVNKGDVLIIPLLSTYNSENVVDHMLIVFVGFKVTDGTVLPNLLSLEREYTYFKASPFFDYYNYYYTTNTISSIIISCNADSMLTTKFTNTITTSFDNSQVNYFYLWSQGENSYVDFTNVFMQNDINTTIIKNKAVNASINTSLTNLVDQSFYSLRQRNSIQNEILNMFSDINILNDLRKVMNLYQPYSISSIFTAAANDYYFLKVDTSSSPVNSDVTPTTTNVYIALFNDTKRNIVGIDIVYCPSGVKIRPPTSTSKSNYQVFYLCNNIFSQYNDLIICCNSMNMNRNLSFTINFMKLRNSEYSTHLVITSKKYVFNNLVYSMFNSLSSVKIPYLSHYDFNNMNTNCYLLDLDDWIDIKHGCIMNSLDGENIRITF